MAKDEIKEYIIRKMEKSDWPEVKKIYLEGIATNLATFQRECPDYSEWDKGHCSHSRLIVAMENEVLAWTLQSSIMQENKASIKLHEKCGFRMVGYRERIGIDSEGIWRNTVLMEKRF